jgi:hypothetical protein
MKKSCIIISAFLLFINSSLRQRAAQPTEQPKPLLTVGQAELLAMRLANDMFGETMSPDYRLLLLCHSRVGTRCSHKFGYCHATRWTTMMPPNTARGCVKTPGAGKTSLPFDL